MVVLSRETGPMCLLSFAGLGQEIRARGVVGSLCRLLDCVGSISSFFESVSHDCCFGVKIIKFRAVVF